MVYTLAEAAARLKPARLSKHQSIPRLWLVSDPVRLPNPAPAIAKAPAGTALLWRPYTLSWQDALREGRCLRHLTRVHKVWFIVAGTAALAATLNADGLHLPEGLARSGCLAPALLWRHHGRLRLMTVACHGRVALTRAQSLGADAVLLSPAFPTASHPGAPSLGPCRFASLARASRLPVIALGGITAQSTKRFPRNAVAGWAAVGAWALGR